MEPLQLAQEPMRIEVISDVVCPWCFIGKRRLEKALSLVEDDAQLGRAEVTWRAFQLNPDMPDEGMERTEYVRRKFGGNAQSIYERVAQAGRTAGIEFAFDRIPRQPNTLRAHQLVSLAQRAGRQDAMVDHLFQAYFLEGKDLTQDEVLVDLAGRAGLPRDAAAEALSNPREREAIAAEDAAARALGVNGVPFFVFNRRLAVSGAQEPDVLVRAMRQAAGSRSDALQP
jgi:predicted DsbA family dithiol-disulfide isomerase